MSDKKITMNVDWEGATFETPPNKIKEQVGSGGISKLLLERAEETIKDNHRLDFIPYASEYLKEINEAIVSNENNVRSLSIISDNIMHLKANGGMFGYMLISIISDVMLNFSDKQENMNNDFIDIIKAYQNTITLILNNKLRGDGGDGGNSLVQELSKAISRYDKKYGNK